LSAEPNLSIHYQGKNVNDKLMKLMTQMRNSSRNTDQKEFQHQVMVDEIDGGW